MPPTDASTDTGAGPAPQLGGGVEDTLDLQLPEELFALFREDELAFAPQRTDDGAGHLLDTPACWGRPPPRSGPSSSSPSGSNAIWR